jgi:hypothetical protein
MTSILKDGNKSKGEREHSANILGVKGGGKGEECSQAAMDFSISPAAVRIDTLNILLLCTSATFGLSTIYLIRSVFTIYQLLLMSSLVVFGAASVAIM